MSRGSDLAPAVFLDRDGTIIEECHYLDDPERVRLMPGVAQGLRLLREIGLRLVLITNQSGVARGILTEARLRDIHDRLEQILAAEGIALDGIYYCPHHPTEGVPPYRQNCDCRKPLPGLFDRACSELGLDPGSSYAVGDKERDILPLIDRGGRGFVLTNRTLLLPPEIDPGRCTALTPFSRVVETIREAQTK